MTNEKLFEKGMFDELYKQNTGFIYKLSYKFRNIPKDEVISAANLGFTKALKTYSLDKDIKFLTYVSRCMVNEILMQTRQLKKQSKDISLEGSLRIDKEGNELTLEDVLPDEFNIEANFMDKVDTENLRAAINRLPERHKVVIEDYLQGINQTETAKKMNVSQSYISRLRIIAVHRLKGLMRGRDYMSKKSDALELMKKGLDDKEIAKRLNSTVGTIATYKCEYKKKLKAAQGNKDTVTKPKEAISKETLTKPIIKVNEQSISETIKETIHQEPIQCNKNLLTPTQFSGTIGEYFIKDNAIQVTVKESQNTINIPKENLKLLIQEMVELDKRIAG